MIRLKHMDGIMHVLEFLGVRSTHSSPCVSGAGETTSHLELRGEHLEIVSQPSEYI